MSAFKLKIIDRLFVFELSKMLASVMLVLSVILISQRLVRYLSKVSSGELSADAVLSLVGFNMVLLLIKLLPLSLSRQRQMCIRDSTRGIASVYFIGAGKNVSR